MKLSDPHEEKHLNMSKSKGLSEEEKLELAKIMNDYTKYSEKVEHEEEAKIAIIKAK
jgi:2,3-bisphosphoglycerate-independent phosphoglycerate mutase